MKVPILFVVLLALGMPLRAQNLDSLLVVARNTRNDSMSIIKMNVAGYYYLFRDHDKGVAILKEARKKAIARKQDYCYVECVNLQGVYHAITEHPDSARFYYEKAKLLSHRGHYANLEVRSTNNLGMLEWNQGNFNRALGLFFEALRENEKIPPGPMKTSNSVMQNNIGLIYQEMELYDKALEYHKLAYYYRLGKNARMELGASCNNMGICYEKLGQFDKAEASYKEGIAFAKQFNPAEYYSLLENYSGTLIDRQRYDEAIRLLLEVLGKPDEILLSERSKLGIYTKLTNAYVNLVQPDSAVEYGRKGLDVVAGQPELETYAADLYIALSRAYYMKGDINSGHAYSQKFSEVTSQRFKNENARGIADMEIKYETEKKEKLIAEGRLKLLKAQAESQLQQVIIAEKESKLLKSLAESEKNEKLVAENKARQLKTEAESARKEQLIAQNEARLLQTQADARKKNYMLLISLCFIACGAAIGYLLFRQQRLRNRQLEKEYELKSALAEIENHNRLQEQRLSISRDLHDNIGAQLTFIISSLDNLKYRLTENVPAVGTKLEGISNFTQQTIFELRDTIWAMNTKHITFEDLRARIGNFIDKAREANVNIDFRFAIDPALSGLELSSVTGMNIYRTIQEAVNNAIKHSEATTMDITVTDTVNSILISISDNGRGFDLNDILPGNGLQNMEKRIEGIGGSFTLDSAPHGGTTIILQLGKAVQSA